MTFVTLMGPFVKGVGVYVVVVVVAVDAVVAAVAFDAVVIVVAVVVLAVLPNNLDRVQHDLRG